MSLTTRIEVISEQDQVLTLSDYSTVHSEGSLHREVDVFVINQYGLLLQKRAKTPQKWVHTGGHVEPKDKGNTRPETWRNAATREFIEELHCDRCGDNEFAAALAQELEEVGCYRRHTTPDLGGTDNNNRLTRVFLLQKDIKPEEFRIDPVEVAAVKYFNGLELTQLLTDSDEVRAGTPYILSAIPYLNMLMVSRCLLWGQLPSSLPYVGVRS